MKTRDFVNSLSWEQLQGLLNYQKDKYVEGLNGIVENHLNGNSDDFTMIFTTGIRDQEASASATQAVEKYLDNKRAASGATAITKTQSKNNTGTADPAVAKYLENKKAANKAYGK